MLAGPPSQLDRLCRLERVEIPPESDSKGGIKMNAKYAGPPDVVVFEKLVPDKKNPGKKKGKTAIQNLLWGDALDLQEETDGEWVRVKVRVGQGSQRKLGWVKRSEIQDEPLLEVTFVDIGQGDGSLVITPDGRELVIDAGERNNMMRYLKWRFMFPSAKRPRKLHAAIISHPDSDHYKGFDKIFAMPGVTFEKLYHNGLVERRASSKLGTLGPRTAKQSGKPRYYTDLITNTKQLTRLLKKEQKKQESPNKKSKKQYPDMLQMAFDKGKFDSFEMLSLRSKHVPGFDTKSDVVIEVLGPVEEQHNSSPKKWGLRDFGNPGLTKNGHSVVLRLTYGKIRMLLGGDLNIPSEKLILQKLVGEEVPSDKKKREAYMKKARKRLEVDIAKSCHHGSADFSALFLEAVNPVATVISSGDNEKHSHPRAETLGAIGVNSRGERPLIYSTELARSAKEANTKPEVERKKIRDAHRAVLKEKDLARRRKLQKSFNETVNEIVNPTVQQYGAIYVRTNGERVVMAQKFESAGTGKQWDFAELKPDKNGQLCFQSKHAEH